MLVFRRFPDVGTQFPGPDCLYFNFPSRLPSFVAHLLSCYLIQDGIFSLLDRSNKNRLSWARGPTKDTCNAAVGTM